MSGFMFDFSAPAAPSVEDTPAIDNTVPAGEECVFTFTTPTAVMAQTRGIRERGIFLETRLPFTRSEVGSSSTSGEEGPKKVRIYHRQAPKVDSLEFAAATNTNNAVAGGAINKSELHSTANKLAALETANGNSSSNTTDDGRKDIVQGAYYGGLKVWSCAPDIAEVVIFGGPVAPPTTADNDDNNSSDDDDSNEKTSVAAVGNTAVRYPNNTLVDYYGQELEAVSQRLTSSTNASASSSSAIAVAELGCGQSLPSIAAVHRLLTTTTTAATKNSTSNSTSNKMLLFLHDYNKEVVDEVSLPNIAKTIEIAAAKLNAGDASNVPNSSLDAAAVDDRLSIAVGNGDWTVVAPSSFAHPTMNPNGYVDVLLAADVTFDMEATEKFLLAAARVLRPPTTSTTSGSASDSDDEDGKKKTSDGGLCLLGTKDYYFGTGGGLEEMKEVIRRNRLPLALTVLGKRGVGTMVRVLVTIRRT